MAVEAKKPNSIQGPLPLATADAWLTPPDLAREMNVALLTLADWRVKGIGPKFAKVGRLVRYRRSDVLAWLDSRTVQSTAQADEMEA